jgi:hypothetical protein
MGEELRREDFGSVVAKLFERADRGEADDYSPRARLLIAVEKCKRVFNRLRGYDTNAVAREMLEQPSLAPLVAALRELPKQKIALIGHSITMQGHWSSPSTFGHIADAIARRVNPGIEFLHRAGTSLNPRTARRDVLPSVLEARPDHIVCVLRMREESDYQEFPLFAEEVHKAKVPLYAFDNYRQPIDEGSRRVTRWTKFAQEKGVRLIPLAEKLAAAPDRARFVSIDRLHMREPYHRLVATTLLAWVASAEAQAAAFARISMTG